MEFDIIEQEVEKILQLDLSSDIARDINNDFVVNVLKNLEAEIKSVKANNYPANPISAAEYLDGIGCGNLARALTEHFNKAGWLKREENASMLWAKAMLATCSHYHHMVGPAMIACADCNDRLGNIDRSTAMYTGVVKDFFIIVNNILQKNEPLDDESKGALESLKIATDSLLTRGINMIEEIDLSLLQSNISKILCR